MKKIIVIVSVVMISLFSNVSPAQAQVAEAIGALQWLSYLLPSENYSKRNSIPDAETLKQQIIEKIKSDPHRDIIPSIIKQKVINKRAAEGTKLSFDSVNENGVVEIKVETQIIDNCIVAWYDSAKVNDMDSVIIIIITLPLPDYNGLIAHIGTIWYNRSDNVDESELQAIKNNQKEKDIYLKQYVQKYLKIFQGKKT